MYSDFGNSSTETANGQEEHTDGEVSFHEVDQFLALVLNPLQLLCE